MREIKFKAHNTKTNEIGYVEEIGFSSYVKVTLEDGKPTHSCIKCKEKDCYTPYWKWDDIELIQSTGRKDKNGKDIYKGYVIRHKNGAHYKVSYCNINSWWYLEGVMGSIKGQDMRLHISEIIGNIYENPELIK